MTMKPVTTSYARYFNRTHEREGKFLRTDLKVSLFETDEEIEECIKKFRKRYTEKTGKT